MIANVKKLQNNYMLYSFDLVPLYPIIISHLNHACFLSHSIHPLPILALSNKCSYSIILSLHTVPIVLRSSTFPSSQSDSWIILLVSKFYNSSNKNRTPSGHWKSSKASRKKRKGNGKDLPWEKTDFKQRNFLPKEFQVPEHIKTANYTCCPTFLKMQFNFYIKSHSNSLQLTGRMNVFNVAGTAVTKVIIWKFHLFIVSQHYSVKTMNHDFNEISTVITDWEKNSVTRKENLKWNIKTHVLLTIYMVHVINTNLLIINSFPS